jgi:hypothetical protein
MGTGSGERRRFTARVERSAYGLSGTFVGFDCCEDAYGQAPSQRLPAGQERSAGATAGDSVGVHWSRSAPSEGGFRP